MLATVTTSLPGYEVTEVVEIVTYDDCIAIMDAAIFDSCDLEELRSSDDLRLALHSKALRAYPQSKTVREAITRYLASLDPHSKEWELWLDAYTEGELIDKFNVDI